MWVPHLWLVGRLQNVNHSEIIFIVTFWCLLLLGNMAPSKRQSIWQSRRVFFLTPQVLQNDLNRGSCKAEEVVLLVADEAHKALGNHAYCQVRQIMLGLWMLTSSVSTSCSWTVHKWYIFKKTTTRNNIIKVLNKYMGILVLKKVLIYTWHVKMPIMAFKIRHLKLKALKF